jgi:ERCC4-type nuclease
MDIRPTIVIDSREQAPLVFRNLASGPGCLTSGDYSFTGGEDLFSIERKSVADLVACCAGSNRERFERELHRLRGYRFKRLLIVGTRAEIERGEYRSNIKPQSVLHTLSAFEARYDCPVVFCPDPTAAALQVESWAYWFSREIVKSFEAFTKGAPAVACKDTAAA